MTIKLIIIINELEIFINWKKKLNYYINVAK